MSANDALRKIPVVVQPAGAARGGGLEWKRRAVQTAAILLLILVPITGVFRIDTGAGFVVLDRQIWFSDFFIVFGVWLALACLLVMFYSTLGTSFCGWVCPQNTLSAWANRQTVKYLGKRATIDWEGREQSKISSGKNKLRNWLILGGKLLLVAMLIALIPMLYFYPADAVWSFVTLRDDPRITRSWYLIYSVFVLLALGNVAVMRYYLCRYTCVYRIWQFLFKTRQTLHITYDQSRSEECAKCNFCVTTCPVDIDPRNTLLYDSCTNCGECITACDSLHKKADVAGLLRFEFGERKVEGVRPSSNLTSLAQRAGWALPVFVLALGMMAWGMWQYQPYDFSVYRSEAWQGNKLQEYRISIAHKIYQRGTVNVRVEGLPKEMYTLASAQAAFDTAERKDIILRISDALPPGVHSFMVRAQSAEGWHDSFRVQHFVGRS
ncbi:MAG: 4Fe-4S binding protein [Rhodocyclaceae bacterium]|nr:4Fe-4S binding protein [Rhodocyclaceae bacterium]